MKVLLLNSPIYKEHTETDEEYLPSLGLCYIATHLEKANVNVEIVDCVKERLGISDVFSLLIRYKPDCIGLNVFTQNLDIVREIAENCPIESHLIIGGQVTKAIYEEILTWPINNRQTIITGESELILPDIVNETCTEQPSFQSGTKRVYHVDSSSHYFPADLSKVHMDRRFLKDEVLTNHYGEKEAAIITSRGCTYDCAFCGAARSRNCDTTIRLRPNADIKEEITNIISLHPEVSSVRILDDLFLRDEKSISAASDLFGEFAHLHWRGMAHTMAFKKAAKLLPFLRQSGCRELFIGVESGSDGVRKRINKPGTSQQVAEVITAVLAAGIDVKAYLMYGFPNESKSEADETFALAKVLATISDKTAGRFRTSVFQYRPYHGTKLYDELVKSRVKIGDIERNETLNVLKGRSQFNFASGNYSDMSVDEINGLILKTQRLTEGINDRNYNGVRKVQPLQQSKAITGQRMQSKGSLARAFRQENQVSR